MQHVYIDPSAWVKRYYHETGTALTNQPLDRLLRSRPTRLLCSRMGILEVVAVLHRHRNAGRVAQSLFNAAYALLRKRHVTCGYSPCAITRWTLRFGTCSCII
jgi:hypothetical protein